MLTAPRPAPVLSFLIRAAAPDRGLPSSLDQLELVSCLGEEPVDMAEPEPGVAPEVGVRFTPKGELCLGLCDEACGSEMVRECMRPGDETKRSARAEAIDGGDFDRDFGKDVRMGKLPGDPESDSRC